MTSGKQRVDGQPAFLLQAHPYRETSLVVDVFSRDYGRIGLVARGAKRPRAALRGVLVEFQPLELGWFGQGELRTLARAEWQRAWPMLAGPRLLLGYYLNELLQRLLAREDAHPALFDLYADTLQKLALAPRDDQRHEALLRGFEKALLRELGYGLTLDADAHGEAVDAGASYVYRAEQGLLEGEGGSDGELLLSGAQALAIQADDYTDPQVARLAKSLMRSLLAHYLQGQELRTRRVFIELQDI
ncbi:MAG: DNA repair protein RecO [Gammaproteobacteria bacterium]|nr:DNA repair protein RecO [Gammaproteobacteria bacterium]MBU0773098.1 DNA repair protein RecO [Gammaproteobacteria bacterium]MBU0855736.1 DNA repair protein RecO [Gammaproteobacteria bacterium]MBU1846995.1 DNA repair protein RecO [Gammaproteobacteria bacterium]